MRENNFSAVFRGTLVVGQARQAYYDMFSLEMLKKEGFENSMSVCLP